MKTIPGEFSSDYIAARSAPESQMYHAERSLQEPMKSVLENNPEIYFVPPKCSSEWGNAITYQGPTTTPPQVPNILTGKTSHCHRQAKT